jgi:predicted Zn-dependent protease with MMP-like domain
VPLSAKLAASTAELSKPDDAAQAAGESPKRLDVAEAAAQRLRETLVQCIADLEDDCQLKLSKVESLAGRLKRASAEHRKTDADRERIKDEMEGVAKAVGRALGLLDVSAVPAELHRPGRGNGAAAGNGFDPGLILRETIARASRRIGGLCEELGELQLSQDLAKSQLSHLQSQIVRLRQEKQPLDGEVAELARDNALLRAQNRLSSRQVGTLVAQTSQWLDEQAWCLRLFATRCEGFAVYAESVNHDPRRLFAFLLLSEIRARADVSDEVKAHAGAIADIFDPVYYLSKYPDIGRAGLNPLLHYVTAGWDERRRPHLFFDTEYYLGQVGAIDGDPLLDYATTGVFEGRKPHPLLDGAYYWQRNPDVAAAEKNPIFHYQVWGGREHRSPSPMFDTEYFVEKYNSPMASDNPLQDYLQQGGDWAVDPHPLFSAVHFAREAGIAEFSEAPLITYLKWPDLWASAMPHPLFDLEYLRAKLAEHGLAVPQDMSPFEYFCHASATADIDPHRLFDSGLYRYQVENEQKRELSEPPIVDYLKRGYCDKSLLPTVLFDPETYAGRNPGEIDGPELVHYCLEGDRAGFWCHPMFCAEAYNSGRDDGESMTALEHYLRSPPAATKISHPHLDRPLAREPQEFVAEVINSAGEVDPDFYRAANPDLGSLSDAAAVAHFNEHGREEGRFGSPRHLVESLGLRIRDIPLGFFAEDYIRFNPDLAVLGSDFRALFKHYLETGRLENRSIGQWQFYLSALPGPQLSRPIARLASDSALPHIEVGLLIHVFYDDLWPELAAFAGNFDGVTRDVFINVVDEAWTPRLQREIRDLCPGAFVQMSNNNGRDVGGHLRMLDNVEIGKYELFALMQTKKSPHIAPEKGTHWRRALLDAFAGSRETVAECVGLFREDPTVGLIGCADHRDTTIGKNEAIFEALLDRFHIDEEHRDPEYLSGTMFMIRSDIVRQLYETLKETEFEYGGDRDDGQIAHGVERLIGCLVRQMGYRIVWR